VAGQRGKGGRGRPVWLGGPKMPNGAAGLIKGRKNRKGFDFRI
jgi:hypothetical protein